MTAAWTPEDLRELQRIYGSRTDARVAHALGRPVEDVTAKAAELALAKDKRSFPGARAMPRWTAEELEKLRVLYPATPNRDIAQLLGRSLKSVVSKGCALGLRKDGGRLEEMGRQNVGMRQDRLRSIH